MSEDEFYALVAEMRAKQNEYFRTRDANVLNECRKLERQVDRAIADREERKKGGFLFT